MTEAERLAQALTDWSDPEVCDLDRLDAAALLRSQAAELEAMKQTLHDELDANLRLRELGGARSDEPMTTFLERVFAERDALRAALIWYRDEAAALHKYVGSGAHTNAVLASVTVLALDAGARADAAIDAARQQGEKP